MPLIQGGSRLLKVRRADPGGAARCLADRDHVQLAHFAEDKTGCLASTIRNIGYTLRG